jgi:beta-aspartyl-peptidase (threonine type)
MQFVPVVVVHGGAGNHPEPEVARAGCRRAVAAALELLGRGGSALDAAQAAVRVLEDEPVFNAGRGSVLTRDGTVEVDAAIMEGTTLRLGAVAAMPDCGRAIEVARAVLESGEHTLLCAEGAWAFAREHGFAPARSEELITDRSRERLAEARQRFQVGRPPVLDPGTVGACALDQHGRLAAATSTGGMTFKRSGRIGDTPLAGCGTYADDDGGAASATGQGEYIMRVAMASHAVERMRGGASAALACRDAVDKLGRRVRGEGGIIAIDRRGRPGAAHNSAQMAFGAGAVAPGAAPVILAEVAVAPELDLAAALGLPVRD